MTLGIIWDKSIFLRNGIWQVYVRAIGMCSVFVRRKSQMQYTKRYIWALVYDWYMRVIVKSFFCKLRYTGWYMRNLVYMCYTKKPYKDVYWPFFCCAWFQNSHFISQTTFKIQSCEICNCILKIRKNFQCLSWCSYIPYLFNRTHVNKEACSNRILNCIVDGQCFAFSKTLIVHVTINHPIFHSSLMDIVTVDESSCLVLSNIWQLIFYKCCWL